MVLAVRLERDVLEKDDLVVAAHFLERAIQVPRRIFLIALGIFAPRAGHAPGRIEQPLPVRIVARPADESPDRLLDVLWYLRGRRVVDQVAVFRLAMLERWIHSFSSRAISSATAA